jgi:hypothetical protein
MAVDKPGFTLSSYLKAYQAGSLFTALVAEFLFFCGYTRMFACQLLSEVLTASQASFVPYVISPAACVAAAKAPLHVSQPLAHSIDYLNDWRELRLERETWRTADYLMLAKHTSSNRKKYYADVLEPTRMANKVST